MARTTGTREWAPHSDNCATGCEHNCKYCYARYDAVRRWKRVPASAWTTPVLRTKSLKEKKKKLDGAVMFPTQHDITPSLLGACMKMIDKHLKAGNRLLIVSKPHLYCIDAITEMVPDELKDQILFRFTIGSAKDEVLSFWEPGAPCFGERAASLKMAQRRGFETSVSSEPLLSPTVDDALALVAHLEPHVTQSIWIGMLNKAGSRVEIEGPEEQAELDRVLRGQTVENVRAIYEALKDQPLIRWKDSYKEALGLDAAEESELAD